MPDSLLTALAMAAPIIAYAGSVALGFARRYVCYRAILAALLGLGAAIVWHFALPDVEQSPGGGTFIGFPLVCLVLMFVGSTARDTVLWFKRRRERSK